MDERVEEKDREGDEQEEEQVMITYSLDWF